MACPAPGVPIGGSMQRNKLFGAVGAGNQPSFMQHGGNGSSSIAATYMQNKLRSKQQVPTLSNHFGMTGAKSSQQNMEMMGNEDNIHQGSTLSYQNKVIALLEYILFLNDGTTLSKMKHCLHTYFIGLRRIRDDEEFGTISARRCEKFRSF